MTRNDNHDKIFKPTMEAANLTEAEKSDIKVLNEGTIVTLSTDDILGFINDHSDNVKAVSEAFNFDLTGLGEANFDRSANILTFKKDQEALKVFLESSMVDRIDDFILSF